MNLYRMYVGTKTHIRESEKNKHKLDEDELNQLEDIKLSTAILEEVRPEFLAQYTRETQMQSSLTKEQKDFICWQIGEWYIEWKERIITDLENGTHRLGLAKEQLKDMICGER